MVVQDQEASRRSNFKPGICKSSHWPPSYWTPVPLHWRPRPLSEKQGYSSSTMFHFIIVSSWREKFKMANSLDWRVTCAHVVFCWFPQCDATPWGQPEWKPILKSKHFWSHLSGEQLLVQPVNLPNLRIEIKIALNWQLFQVQICT